MLHQGLATVAKAASIGAPPFTAASPTSSRKSRISDRVVLDVLMAFEIGLFVLAAVIAHVACVAAAPGTLQLQPYVLAGLAGGIIGHYVLRSRGQHDIAAVIAWKDQLGSLLTCIALALSGLVAIAVVLQVASDYPGGWLLAWLAVLAVLLPLGRSLWALGLRRLAVTGRTGRRIAVVAQPAAAPRMIEGLRRAAGMRVVGIFTDESAQSGIAALIAAGQRNEIDEIVVDLSHVPPARLAGLLDQLSVLPVEVWLYSSEIGVPVLSTASIGPISLLQVKPKPIRDWGVIAKLALDYLVGSIALILFAPLMLAIAVAIKLDSPGNVIFRQRRHGYNHRVIDVFKFRTMHVAENGDRIDQARRNDPRVTRIGNFLRRTSLDELPQLFNVLRGEMSLVGPRPHAVAHNRLYEEILERYANRHCVKPGITGWAQINGFRGPTEDAEKMRQRVAHDLYYIENWSTWLDFKILALTPLRGFVNPNAL
jgi:Undecaprenyl-phosphate glucose phosphotransferase